MRKKNGWGLGMMIVLMCIIIFFGFVALFYIFRMYDGGILS